jgi:glutamate--cysteine ligase catalytic subunit
VDDRTDEERGKKQGGGNPKLAGNGTRFLPKSRYDSIDCYIGDSEEVDKQAALYNDRLVVSDPAYVQKLKDNGIDDVLAHHVAHLFARDPLVIFGDRIELDDSKDVDHWENLQSTNWQTMRWKPPSPEKASFDIHSQKHIGWRVEFRPMELQMTDFENAAFTSFIMLLSRVILGFKLNLYMPMSKLEENMQIAGQREACTNGQFWFRADILPRQDKSELSCPQPYEPMSIADILAGTDLFPGLIPLCEAYLDFVRCDSETRALLQKYMNFILQRAQGKMITTATWMRRFVMEHPSYKKDSRVPAAAAYDLMAMTAEIGQGRQPCPEVLGNIQIPVVEPAKSASQMADSAAGSQGTLLHSVLQRLQAA